MCHAVVDPGPAASLTLLRTCLVVLSQLIVLLPARAVAQGTYPPSTEPRSDAYAENAAPAPVNAPRAICFRGAPLERCRSFTITEWSLSAWLSSPPGENPPALVGEFGAMFNADRHNAFGATGWLDVGHETVIFGASLRYRRWLSSRFSLDLGLGIPVIQHQDREDRFDLSPGGWTVVKAKLNYGDLVGLVTRVEVPNDVSSLGIELGSAPGLIATLATVITGMIMVATIDPGIG